MSSAGPEAPAGPVTPAAPGADPPGPPAREPGEADREHAGQIRGSALLLLGTLLSSAVDFGAQVVLVRYLSKDAYGAWSYALAIVALFAGIAQFELRTAAARFIPIYLERRDRQRLLGTVVVALGTAAALGTLIAIVIGVGVGLLGFRPTGDPRAIRLLLLVLALIPIQAVDAVFTGLFAAFGASRTIFVRQSVVAPGLRILLILALVALRADVTLLAVGYVGASLAGIGLYATALSRLLRRRGVRILGGAGVRLPAREVLTFAAPMLTTTVVWMLMESSDAILLGWFFDPAAVASFRVVLPLARMNGLVSSVFSVLFLPLASRAYERGDLAAIRDLYWRTALWMTVLSLPVLVATAAFAPSVTVGLYGEAYAGSAPILALLACGYVFNTALGFNGLTVKVHGRLRYTVVIDVIAAVANVAVNLALIPRLGPIGAAIGTASTLILHNVLKHVALSRLTTVPAFDRRYLPAYAGLAAIALGMAAIGALVPVGLVGAAVLAAVAGVLGVVVARGRLDVRAMFPEVDRLPLPAWLLRLIGPPVGGP